MTCPVHPAIAVQARMCNGDLVGPIPAGAFDWFMPGDQVTHYRIWRGDAFQKLASIAENPAPVREQEPA